MLSQIVRPPNFRVQVLSLLSAGLYSMFPRPTFVFVLTFVNSGWHILNHVLRDREISSPLSWGSLASFFPFSISSAFSFASTSGLFLCAI